MRTILLKNEYFTQLLYYFKRVTVLYSIIVIRDTIRYAKKLSTVED